MGSLMDILTADDDLDHILNIMSFLDGSLDTIKGSLSGSKGIGD